ncbi:MAG: GTPase Era [Bacteroidota bacterium]
MSETPHKSGFVSIIGKPNAGKSTLMNALIGRKLAITTAKAQTTRHRIIGILSQENFQIVFSDTPGVIPPKYRLHRTMMNSVRSSLEDADVMILLVDVNEKFPEDLVIKLARKSSAPVLLVLNKVDQSDEARVRARYEEITAKVDVDGAIGISARHGINLLALRDMILERLPAGPPYFDKDMLSDRPERFFISEIIRERVFVNMKQEIPYSSQVEVIGFEEEKELTYIDANIYVERDSQKGMVVGKGGSMIKRIGQEARREVQEFLGKKVHLELHVKVAEGWKDSSMRLRYFGYGRDQR